MNKLIILVATLLLLTPAIASANLLSDPGFEGLGAGPWTNAINSAGFTRDYDSTEQVRTDLQSLKVNWGSVTGWGGAASEQNISVSAGQPWIAEVYAKIPSPFTGKEAYLETKFFTSLWAEISTLQSSKLQSTVDWTLLTNSGTVPADAATAQYRLVVWGGNSSGGTVYWDDANAVVPEPTSLLLLGSGLLGLLGLSRKKR